MKKLAEMFFTHAKTNGEKEALWCDNVSLTYKDLAKKVSQYIHFLQVHNIEYGDHIGIPMNNSIESVVLILTAATMGVGLVPLNPTQPPIAMKPAFKIGQVKHLIARKSFLEQMYDTGINLVDGSVICMDNYYKELPSLLDADKCKTSIPDISHITGKETFILTMTSGSTGSPKPIHLTQENKYVRSIAHIQLYNLTKDDRILAATPLYHSLAERLVLMPLLIGATAVLMPRFTPDLWLECVKKQKVTFTIAVSAQLAQILNTMNTQGIDSIGNLRSVVSSSALLDLKVKEALIQKLHCEFHEMYGTSETSTITNICFSEEKDKYRSVGKSIKEAKIQILDEENKPVKSGIIGEIACQSLMMCSGYYQKDKIFEEALVNGYFKTGDMGYLDEEGYLYFSGRKKEIIITGAVNVYPQDIESVVNQIEEVAECAAFSYPDERLGEVVALAIVVKPNMSLKLRTVQIKCAKNLADFQQPHKIFFLNELPKNSMNKLIRGKLIEIVKE